MEKLAAVNLIRNAIGVPSASALDTGSNNLAGEAETYLDNKLASVLMERWWFNASEYDVELELPDSRFEVTGGAGTFTFDEIVTQTTSGATGKFKYLLTVGATTYMYLVAVSGTFTVGSLTLTGGTSGATKTGASYTAITEARHAVPDSYLRVVPAPRQNPIFVKQGSYLYNPDPAERTLNWEENVFADVQRELSWTELTEAQQEYIARAAAYEFQFYKKPSERSGSRLYQMMLGAKTRALQEDVDAAPARKNFFDGTDALRARGRIYDQTGRMPI